MQLLAQAGEFGLLVVIRCFDLLQLANLRLEHGSFDLGFFQCFVIGRLGGGSGCCALRGTKGLLCFVQLLAQAGEFGLLIVIRCFDLLQLANLCLEHGGFDLGFFRNGIVWPRRSGGRSGVRLHGGIQRTLRGLGGVAQIGNLGFQLGSGMGGQLLLGFLQGDLGHAGLDLKFLLRFGKAGLLCRGRRLGCGRGRAALALRRLGACRTFGTGLAFGFLLFFGAP